MSTHNTQVTTTTFIDSFYTTTSIAYPSLEDIRMDATTLYDTIQDYFATRFLES